MFLTLELLASWLDMRYFLLCILFVNTVGVLTEDYLQGATQKGLDYIRQIGLPYLEKEIDNLEVPNFDGTTNTPLGAISYGLSSIRIKNVSIPKSNMTINEKQGLTISCSDAKMLVNSKWKYKEKSWPHIKDSGSVNIQMKSISLETTIFMDTRDEKFPKVETRKCLLKIGQLNVKFNGGASWLYNIFANAIAKDLKGTISKQVCDAVSEMIDKEGTKMLREVPDVVKTIKEHLNVFKLMNP